MIICALLDIIVSLASFLVVFIIIVLIILKIIVSHVNLRRFSRVIIVAIRSFHARINFAIGSSSPLKEEFLSHKLSGNAKILLNRSAFATVWYIVKSYQTKMDMTSRRYRLMAVCSEGYDFSDILVEWKDSLWFRV